MDRHLIAKAQPERQMEQARLALATAVRRYAREPNENNAGEVETAVTRLRRVRSVMIWREPVN